MSSINSEIHLEKNFGSQDSLPLSKVQICGEGNECIIIGGMKYYRHELYSAFAGTLQTERFAPKPVHEFGNATAYALAAFGITTITFGLYLTNAHGIVINNAIVGITTCCTAPALLVAGIFEFFKGNTFGCTLFISFSGFWWGFSTILIPSFGIADAYKDDPEQLSNAIGLWLLGWDIFVAGLLSVVLKSTWDLVITFITLEATLILLTAFYFTGNHGLQVSGGVTLIICGFFALYIMVTGIATKTNSYFKFSNLQVPIFGENGQ
jgi:succinate-acetate transporter protein